jgi:Protein of unknown function (DUF2975)
MVALQFYLWLVFVMNAIETLAKVETRMKRIKEVSRIFRFLAVFSFFGGIYFALSFCFGWPVLFQGRVGIAASYGHVYHKFTEMPATIQFFWLAKTVLALACNAVLYLLFRLYEQGILFSVPNIRYIRFLGYGLAINWAFDYAIQSALKEMNLSMTPLFVGFLVIFVAWIMDEGRKIQEEQELTV